MRLAFAVAAHLEPEILIVDEVLAVGDAQFQKKCLGKMEEVGQEGRTVLFVSHNMAAIRALCKEEFFWIKDKLLIKVLLVRLLSFQLNAGTRADELPLTKLQSIVGC